MKKPMVIFKCIMLGLLLAGCSCFSATPPSSLIDAVKQRASDLPKHHILIKGGGESEYFMVVRQVKNTSKNRQSSFPTNSVQGEWFFANKYMNPDAMIRAARKIGTKGLFTVHFFVAQVAGTNAVVDVFVSYGERGGHTMRWSFVQAGEKWELTKDDRMGFSD